MPHGIKVYITGPGQMTKMAIMPIYSKNPIKIIFSRATSRMALKLGTKHQGLEPYNVYLNDDPGLTLVYFTLRSTLFT